MILDRGICHVYKLTNVAEAGNKPTEGLVLDYQSWYRELNFETSPVHATPAQEDVQVSARVRIHQNRAISNHNVVILSDSLEPPIGAVQFHVIRAFHGIDRDNGQPITDLSLREVQQQYDITGVPRPVADG